MANKLRISKGAVQVCSKFGKKVKCADAKVFKNKGIATAKFGHVTRSVTIPKGFTLPK